ncbi:helicase-like protein [Thermolongibacillus altinsuensis]|jgi:SNF2 family DNA or RNA helicase|uniref:Helicase-like protein n=1 Tax=Thermolongibacillus altinsuensis TaxID=575256 RepID=A0A4R1QFL5_9BACL|nr:SNF2-related protein [Thermolongibacillus altinsuensis]TCL48791.1 helicase-like protein [Thermolongibacillus altinsuensis]GMB07649.1 putative ATP-dependent helicase YqhH [Thermolongibacillus altinsuensis]
MDITIEWDRDWKEQFLERLERDGPWASWELYDLAFETAQHLTIPQFDGLQAPKHLPNLTILPHQYEVAKQVVEEMNGKAILADEVGLGKTIEAGLILKEYMIRGLVKKVLILVPASLVSQWVKELNEKFFIPAVPQKKSYVWEQCDIVVSSIDTAKKSPHREIIYAQNYDMVIIDEAHKLKNNKTKNYEFVQHLKKKFCLLLTATPIQNRIEEIFHLVSLLKPGHLGNVNHFQEKYGKMRSLNEDEHLKTLIRKVMIRNRRNDTGIEWKKRKVETIFIDFSPEERALYEAIQQLKREPLLSGDHSLSLITLLREACSSREAVFFTLKAMLDRSPSSSSQIESLIEKIQAATRNAKAEKALELIQQINDKVIIFTEYRATQLYLQWFLQQHGISSVPFRGGFKRSKKDWMKELFEQRIQVLIATEAGGEGINLQFCNHLINYDLPWNPMRLEQRIGRIHRLGQTKDVHIYNFAVRNTVEEHIFTLLYEKIRLFERVIGELDDILIKFQSKPFAEHLEHIIFHSQNEGEMRIKMENLTEILSQTRGETRAAT